MKILLTSSDQFWEICRAQNLLNPIRYASNWSIREGKTADRGATGGIVSCTGGNITNGADEFTFHQTPKSYGIYFEENRDTFRRQSSRLQEQSSAPLRGLIIGGLSRHGNGASYLTESVSHNYEVIRQFLDQSGINPSSVTRCWGTAPDLPTPLAQASIACIPDEDVQVVNVTKQWKGGEQAVLTEKELQRVFEDYYIAPGDRIITPQDESGRKNDEYDTIVKHLLDADARDAKDIANHHLLVPRVSLEDSPTWQTFQQYMATGNVELQKQMGRQSSCLQEVEQLKAIKALLATGNQEVLAELAMNLWFLSKQDHIQLKTFKLLLARGDQQVLDNLVRQIHRLPESGTVQLKLFRELTDKGEQNILESLAFELSRLLEDIQHKAFACLVEKGGQGVLERLVMVLGFLPDNRQLPAFKTLLAAILEKGSPTVLDNLVFEIGRLAEEVRWDAFQTILEIADESVRRRLKAQIESLLPEQKASTRQALA